jgi:hypothetical protein
MFMLALQLVIGVGIALLFPLLIRTGVAAVKPPPKPSTTTDLRAENTDEDKQYNRDRINRDRAALQSARAAYARILFAVMAPAGVAAVIAGYFIGINAIGVGLLTGGILCSVWGYAGHWEALPQGMRFVSILGGLLMLLYIGSRYLGA